MKVRPEIVAIWPFVWPFGICPSVSGGMFTFGQLSDAIGKMLMKGPEIKSNENRVTAGQPHASKAFFGSAERTTKTGGNTFRR